PNFTLSASPTSLTITQGAGGSSIISITPQNGFSSSVSFTASGLPNGVTASFNPSSDLASTTLTLTATSTAAVGTFSVTVIGTSGALMHQTKVNLSVNPAGNYTLSASPTSLSIARGTQGKTTVTITPLNGFSSSVTFSASGLHSGVSASFSPNPGTL